MYQLRFLIATPRKMSPHVFCHRDFRGQRTQQDDFHNGFNTFVCPAKGDKSSQDIMLELFQSAAAHQPNSHLFPIVELFDQASGDRIKLAGNEIVIRPCDLQAAQEAIASTTPVNPVKQVKEEPQPPSTEQPSTAPSLSVLDRVQSEIRTNGKATATSLALALDIDATNIKAAVSEPNSGLQNKGGWISFISE